MARDITLTFDDGSTAVYRNAPDDVTPGAVMERAGREFSGKTITQLDGGRHSAGQADDPARMPLNRWVNPSKAEGGRGNIVNPAPVEPPGVIDRAMSGARNLADGVASTGRALKDQFGSGLGGTIRTLGQVVGVTPEGAAATLTNLGGKVMQAGGHLVDAFGQAMAPADEAVMHTVGADVTPQGPAQPSPGQAADNYMRERVAPAAAKLADMGRQRVARTLADPKADPLAKAAFSAGQELEGIGQNQQQFYQDKIASESPDMAAQSKAIDDAKGFFDTVKAMAVNPLGTAGMISQSLPDMLAGMGLSRGAVALRMSEASGLAAKASQLGDDVFEKTLLKYGADPKMAGQARQLATQARTKAISEFVDSAAERTAGGTGLVTEAVQSGGNTRAQVQDFVGNQPDDKLRANNARYRDLRRTHTEQEAKAILGDELGNQASGMAGLWTGAAGKASGAADAWGHTMAGHPVTARQAIGGTAKEGLEEALQNPGEDYAGHEARVQADPNDQYDFGGSVAQGAVAGMAQGGAMHGGGYALSQARQLRSDTFNRFDDLAAAHGLSAKAAAAVKKAVEKVPLDELPAKLKQVTQIMARKGLFGLSPNQDAIDSLDHPPVQDTKPTKAEPTLAPDGQQAASGAVPGIDQGSIASAASDTGADATGLADEPAPVDPAKEHAAKELDAAAHAAATSPNNDLPEPTEAQKKVGNYSKGHIRIQGLDIAIENPAGSVRSGVSPDGAKWENTLQHHYGYVKGTVGNDKDHLDVFVKPGITPDWNGSAFVVDQVDPSTGKLDEHKVVLGAKDEAEAEAIYRSNYAKDWQGFGAITRLPMPAFKAWAKSGKLKAPLGDISGVVPSAPKQEQAPAPAAAPELIGGKPVADMQTGQLLRISKMDGASARVRQVAATEVKRRETEAMWAQRDQETEAQRTQIQSQAKDQQVEQAVATSNASETQAPTALAAAFQAATEKKAKREAANAPAVSEPVAKAAKTESVSPLKAGSVTKPVAEQAPIATPQKNEKPVKVDAPKQVVAAKPEPKAISEKPAPMLGKEVSREIGQFKEGMSEFRANQVKRDLSKQHPNVSYSVEFDPELKHGYAVVGRKPVGKVAPQKLGDIKASIVDGEDLPKARDFGTETKGVERSGKVTSEEVSTLDDPQKHLDRKDIAAKVLQGQPVAEIVSTRSHSNFAELKAWALEVFKAAGGAATNPKIGEVVLNAKSVKDSIAHGVNAAKSAAFEAVPSVISKGALIAASRVGREDHFFISAPVRIAGVDDVVTVLVHRDVNTQRMYLHSVTTKENLLKPQDSTADTKVSEPRGKLTSGEVASVLRDLLSFKQGSEAPTHEQSHDTQIGDFGGDYTRLDGKTVSQQFRIESTGQVATMKMDARQAMEDLDRRESALKELAKCLKGKGGAA